MRSGASISRIRTGLSYTEGRSSDVSNPGLKTRIDHRQDLYVIAPMETQAQTELASSEQTEQIPTHFFQAIACIEGTYTPQTDDYQEGIITTNDGVVFKTRVQKKAYKSLVKRCELLAGVDTPELRWGTYPRLDKSGAIILSVMCVVEHYFLESGQMTASGVVIYQSETQFRLRVYRNEADGNAWRGYSQYSDLDFEGQAGVAIGDCIKVMSHRNGTTFVVDETTPVCIPTQEDVEKHLRRTLGKEMTHRESSNPINAPIKRQKVKSQPPVRKHSDVNGDVRDCLQAAMTTKPPDVSVPSTAEPTPVEQPTVRHTPPRQKGKPKKAASDPPSIPLETPLTQESTRRKPFIVQVEGRQFPGKTSVELKNEALIIDGRVVAKTKQATVIGQPRRVVSDGKVQTEGNQIVLSSKTTTTRKSNPAF